MTKSPKPAQSRTVAKRKITLAFKSVEEKQSEAAFKSAEDTILPLLNKIKEIDAQILDSMDLGNNGEELSEEFQTEIDRATNYHLEQSAKLNELRKMYSCAPTARVSPAAPNELKLPNLKCSSFSGDDADALKFHDFITQFKNVVDYRSNLCNSAKMTYLKSYLSGYALKVVSHLKTNDENYNVALNLLESEFLNKEQLVDDLFGRLISLKPESDEDYQLTKLFINEVRCLLSDLKNYGKDLLADPASEQFVSHIVFSKLPALFRQEAARKFATNFPSVSLIFDNYVEILRMLSLRNVETPILKSSQTFSADKSVKPKKYKNVTLSNVSNCNSTPQKLCKFCDGDHSMINCKKYRTHSERTARCKELKICSRCTSLRHDDKACASNLPFACPICGKTNHVHALCRLINPKPFNPKVFTGTKAAVTPQSPSPTVDTHAASASEGLSGSFLLPTLTISIKCGGNSTSVRCLVDTGSQRSYLSGKVLERLKTKVERNKNIIISTFLESENRRIAEANLCVDLGGELNNIDLPFLVDDRFNLNFDVANLCQAVSSLEEKYKLADVALVNCDNSVHLEGLLGVDIIQNFPDFELIKCCGGSAFRYVDGIIPFGNVESFLSEIEPEEMYEPNELSGTSSSVVNFILNPLGNQFDPVTGSIVDSQVDGNLDKIFSVESLGLDDNAECSNFDVHKIKCFADGIEFKDGFYHVDLPWLENKIKLVPSNFEVARAVLSRVAKKLINMNLFEDYTAVFEQQLADGIMQELDLSQIDVKSRVWIPHRPVIKTADNVTTKIRPVLNCSLKTGDSVSLNEAAFPGIDLLQRLLHLLFTVRFNDFLVIADIKQAFLQIKLKSEADKRRFSLLWQTASGKIRAFQYCSIVFGFVSSPFILNYVIKHHIAQYPADNASNILSNNFYVDNLFFSGNCTDDLLLLYETIFDRMRAGGFILRSWVSNNSDLQVNFDAKLLGVQNTVENLLGYKYDSNTDEIVLADYICDELPEKLTKRLLLSLISRLFDPLGFYLPVVVTGKLIVREIWSCKVDWDEEIPTEIDKKFRKFYPTLAMLSTVKFDRKLARDNADCSLVIFSDASQDMYGFCAYLVDHGEQSSNLIFAKCKVAPQKSKTLPTLELLAVYLATKCFSSIMNGMSRVNVTSVVFCVDAQIVLSWILSGNIRSKNIFARNRLQDVAVFRETVKDNLNLDCVFKYIPTEINPADLLTRGVPYKEFLSKMDLWKHGPEFLRVNPIEWPQRDMKCLSNESKLLTLNVSSVEEGAAPLIAEDKYSDLFKLFRVTAYVKLFIALKVCRNENVTFEDCIRSAQLYWINYVQHKWFDKEIEFLSKKSARSGPAPSLVKSLNLFLDENAVLRCKGRISKCMRFDYDLCNPVLLPKDCFFTSLIIRYFHNKCSHLGVSSTLNCVRNEGFWIVCGRSSVSKVLNKCSTCKRFNAVPFRYPKRTDFLADRVNFVHPFKHVGVDFTGFLTVKFGDDKVKMYLLIFTCLNIRAVHIELLPSMSSLSFLLAFIRFCNLFCMPNSLYSDNASSFLQAAGVLQASTVDDEVSEYLTQNNIKHVKIPLYSAWAGAAWERLIRVIKACLYKAVGRKVMDYF